MFSKKSIELSMNFLVIIIITIVIFGFGVYFISSLSSQAADITKLTLKDLDDKISDLACDRTSRVCISPDTKTIPRNKYDFFGIKIVNVINDENFNVKVTQSITVNKNGNTISGSTLKINPQDRNIQIKKNEGQKIGVGIGVPKNAVSGTYIFNVEIKNGGVLYGNVQKLYVDVP